jgi:EAL domain-containing protein (putative c-di-GMP-specific phosphodiesterase class I)
VENPDILRLLKESGVDYVQGFYVARPKQMELPADAEKLYPLARKG